MESPGTRGRRAVDPTEMGPRGRHGGGGGNGVGRGQSRHRRANGSGWGTDHCFAMGWVIHSFFCSSPKKSGKSKHFHFPDATPPQGYTKKGHRKEAVQALVGQKAARHEGVNWGGPLSIRHHITYYV